MKDNEFNRVNIINDSGQITYKNEINSYSNKQEYSFYNDNKDSNSHEMNNTNTNNESYSSKSNKSSSSSNSNMSKTTKDTITKTINTMTTSIAQVAVVAAASVVTVATVANGVNVIPDTSIKCDFIKSETYEDKYKYEIIVYDAKTGFNPELQEEYYSDEYKEPDYYIVVSNLNYYAEQELYLNRYNWGIFEGLDSNTSYNLVIRDKNNTSKLFEGVFKSANYSGDDPGPIDPPIGEDEEIPANMYRVELDTNLGTGTQFKVTLSIIKDSQNFENFRIIIFDDTYNAQYEYYFYKITTTQYISIGENNIDLDIDHKYKVVCDHLYTFEQHIVTEGTLRFEYEPEDPPITYPLVNNVEFMSDYNYDTGELALKVNYEDPNETLYYFQIVIERNNSQVAYDLEVTPEVQTILIRDYTLLYITNDLTILDFKYYIRYSTAGYVLYENTASIEIYKENPYVQPEFSATISEEVDFTSPVATITLSFDDPNQDLSDIRVRIEEVNDSTHYRTYKLFKNEDEQFKNLSADYAPSQSSENWTLDLNQPLYVIYIAFSNNSFNDIELYREEVLFIDSNSVSGIQELEISGFSIDHILDYESSSFKVNMILGDGDAPDLIALELIDGNKTVRFPLDMINGEQTVYLSNAQYIDSDPFTIEAEKEYLYSLQIFYDGSSSMKYNGDITFTVEEPIIEDEPTKMCTIYPDVNDNAIQVLINAEGWEAPNSIILRLTRPSDGKYLELAVGLSNTVQTLYTDLARFSNNEDPWNLENNITYTYTLLFDFGGGYVQVETGDVTFTVN